MRRLRFRPKPFCLAKARHKAPTLPHLQQTQHMLTQQFFPPSSGLKIGDEILLLNGKPASALRMDDMRAAFVNSALSLSISTLPELDPRASCSAPPRRSDWEQDPTTDIFSQNQGKHTFRFPGNAAALVKQIKPASSSGNCARMLSAAQPAGRPQLYSDLFFLSVQGRHLYS